MANDHYVPRFILRNFEIAGKSGMVYSYMRGKQPRAIAIGRVASEENYYKLKSSEVLIDRNFPDEFLQRLESAAAPVIKRLLTATTLDLYLSEHLTLAWFIAFLANRTPWARQRLINLDKAVWVKRIKAVCRDVPLFEIVMKEKEPDKSPEELEKSRQALLNLCGYIPRSLLR